MEKKVHYGTVTEALKAFNQQGFTIDFNLEENFKTHNNEKYHPEDFEIVDVYRYEGITDPGDEASVYAIQSKTGVKGVYVTGYGASPDNLITKILKKLH